MASDLNDRHARALARFQASADTFSDQRQRELDDLRFIDFDEQWPDAIKTARGGTPAQAGMPAVPARPCLTINQLRAPVQQVTNTQRHAKLALQFSAKGAGADSDTADAYEDIVRAIQADSRAHLARNWAFDRAAKCGLGWYRIDTRYVHDDSELDGPDADDQEIVYRRILNQASVYPDPLAQEPDWSDGKCLFLTQDMKLAEYKAAYPDSALAEADSDVLSGIGDDFGSWVFTATDGDEQTVRIAEYWEVVETERKTPRGRVFKDRKVYWAKLNAVEFLEEPREWNGKHIPIIPVIGEESNVNGERRWIGIVRPGRDAQLSYNVMRSGQVEQIGLSSRIPYELDPEQIEGFESFWQQANTRNFPYLPRRTFARNGQPFQPITRNAVEPPIQAITLAAHEAKDDINTTTGIPPVALGQLDPHDRSGTAIKALQGQSEVGTSGYLDNLASMSMMYEGMVVRDLIPRIYDRPGRVVPAVGLDEKRRQVMVNQPFVEKGGQPHPAQPGDPAAQLINLKAGEYAVAVSIGKSYQTRRQESSAVISDLMGVLPPEMTAAIAPAWLEEQDYPGAKKIAAIAKQALPPALQHAYDEGKQSPLPPEVEAKMSAMEQQLQQATQAIQTDQAKQQGMIQKATLDNQAKLQAAQLDAQTRIHMAEQQNATTIAVAHINAATKGLSMQAHAVEEAQALGHEAVQNDADRQHQVAMAQQQHAQTLEAGHVGHEQAREMADMGHQNTLEAQENEAALQPESVESTP